MFSSAVAPSGRERARLPWAVFAHASAAPYRRVLRGLSSRPVHRRFSFRMVAPENRARASDRQQVSLEELRSLILLRRLHRPLAGVAEARPRTVERPAPQRPPQRPPPTIVMIENNVHAGTFGFNHMDREGVCRRRFRYIPLEKVTLNVKAT
uniref:TPP_enzyme_C domain-containing protein n=1 Tax=Steinernema glaseri TaxID=37863 RepID=A0A1I7YDI5_9BILA